MHRDGLYHGLQHYSFVYRLLYCLYMTKVGWNVQPRLSNGPLLEGRGPVAACTESVTSRSIQGRLQPRRAAGQASQALQRIVG